MSRARLITGILLILLGLGGAVFGTMAMMAPAQLEAARREHGWRMSAADHRQLDTIQSGSEALSVGSLVLGGAFLVGGIVVLATGRKPPESPS